MSLLYWAIHLCFVFTFVFCLKHLLVLFLCVLVFVCFVAYAFSAFCVVWIVSYTIWIDYCFCVFSVALMRFCLHVALVALFLFVCCSVSVCLFP